MTKSSNVRIYAIIIVFIFLLVGIPMLVVVGISETLRSESKSSLVTTATARVPQGTLIGQVTPQAAIFRGIPFSQPPVGDNRWKKPLDPASFPNDTWNATFYRPGCPQRCTYKSKKYSCPTETDEDCLYLNIWVPHGALPEPVGVCEEPDEDCKIIIPQPEERPETFEQLPVIVYIHGGNFVTGAGSALLYESRFLADQGNVIIVTINYRLGAFGFLVQGEGRDAAVGNYGIWDQIKALQWVQKNIDYFGGDSNMVTLLGQSSGAESVSVLLTSPHSKHLFHRAGLVSNPFSLPYREFENAKEFGNGLATKVGCQPGNMTCLRHVPVQDIVKAVDGSPGNFMQSKRKLLAIQPWGPVIDGNLLLKMPLKYFVDGDFASMPLIMGATTGEGMFFVTSVFNHKLSTIFYSFAVSALLGPQTESVLGEYSANCTAMCDNRGKLGDIVTDYIFKCPTRRALLSSSNGAHSRDKWFYIFDETLPFKEMWSSEMCDIVSCHSSDLPYIFNNLDLSQELKFNYRQRMLAQRIGSYWTNFAKYGNPNGQTFRSDSREWFTSGPYNTEYWPRFEESGYESYVALKFQEGGDSIWLGPFEHICDFWDGLNSYGEYKR